MRIAGLAHDDRLQELLADEATEGLDRKRQNELERLLERIPIADRDAMQIAAAALTLAIGGLHHAILPATMQQRLAYNGRLLVADVHPPVVRSQNYAGWWLAAAAGIVALLGWTRDRLPGAADTPQLEMARLLREAPDLARYRWSQPVAGYEEVAGEVIWSDEAQTGYLVLRGLPPTEQLAKQYQLWIVDPNRDTRPVDGGVFDMPGDGSEVIVAIDAKLEVQTPQAFAITLEQRGGVVVSDGPLLVTASAGS